MEGFTVKPIAVITTDFPEKFGIPRQAGRVREARGRVVFLPAYRNPDALRELEGFSHLWLIFDFSLAHREGFTPTVRPPRLGGNRRVGVFASRSPFRPNPIGLSCVRLLGIEHTEEEGDVLLVGGVDILSGTPILDVKPYLPSSDAHPEASAGYAAEGEAHRLAVRFLDGACPPLDSEGEAALCALLADDPRPSYQEDGREYHLRFAAYEVDFTVEGACLTVLRYRAGGACNRGEDVLQ